MSADFKRHLIFFFLCSIFIAADCSSDSCIADQCRNLEFGPEKAFDGKRLINHTIRTVVITVARFCENLCYMEPDCVSINLYTPADGNGNYECELNNVTHEGHEDKLIDREKYSYHAAESDCVQNPCKNNATCQSGFTKKGYRCLCTVGFEGPLCGKGATSCKEIHDNNITNVSGVVTLLVDSQLVSVFCHMGDFGCGDGGWTPVMKIDGSQTTFHYDADYWSNFDAFNLPGGETGFDEQESKLPTYWNTSFSRICLSMKIDQQLKFIFINKQADSLHSLIADGQYRDTTLGRNEWKELIGSQAALQKNCNKEGFNAFSSQDDRSKVRIGIVSNNNNDCHSCNSFIGFGTGSHPNGSKSCGNEALFFEPQRQRKSIKAMGYILVQ